METTVFSIVGSQYQVKIENKIGDMSEQIAAKTGLPVDKIRFALVIRLDPDNPDEFKKLLYTIQRHNDSEYVAIDSYIKTIFQVLSDKHPLLQVEHDADTTKIYECQYVHKKFISSVWAQNTKCSSPDSVEDQNWKGECDAITKFLPNDMTLEELVLLMHRYLKRSYLCMIPKLSHPEGV